MWHESTGILIYDPHGRAEKSKAKVSDPWWLILICDNEIIRYYNWWLEKQWIRTEKYSLYGSHVSIVKGEEPPNKELWKKYNKKILKFRYNNEIKTNNYHYWLWTECTEFERIRLELGLSPRFPDMRFHLTIGRKYAFQ
jgi:hypothetical protein